MTDLLSKPHFLLMYYGPKFDRESEDNEKKLVQSADGVSEYTLVGFADSEGSGGQNKALVQHLETDTAKGGELPIDFRLFPEPNSDFQIYYAGASYINDVLGLRPNFFFNENP